MLSLNELLKKQLENGWQTVPSNTNQGVNNANFNQTT